MAEQNARSRMRTALEEISTAEEVAVSPERSTDTDCHVEYLRRVAREALAGQQPEARIETTAAAPDSLLGRLATALHRLMEVEGGDAWAGATDATHAAWRAARRVLDEADNAIKACEKARLEPVQAVKQTADGRPACYHCGAAITDEWMQAIGDDCCEQCAGERLGLIHCPKCHYTVEAKVEQTSAGARADSKGPAEPMAFALKCPRCGDTRVELEVSL